MNKNLKIVIAIGSVALLGIGGNIAKNSYIASQINQNLQQELKNEKQFSYKDISCNGVFTINCKVNKPKIKLDSASGIMAKSIIVNDILSWKNISNLNTMKNTLKDELIINSFKNGISLNISIENMNYYTDKNRDKLKQMIVSQYAVDAQSSELVATLINKLDKSGASGQFNVTLTGKELIAQEVIQTELFKSSLKIIAQYDAKNIKTINDIDQMTNNAIFKEIILDEKEYYNTTLTSLYVLYKQLAHSYNATDRSIVHNINREYSINTDGKNLSFSEFKKLLASQKTVDLIDKGLKEVQHGLQRQYNNKDLLKITADIAQKLKGLAKGDDTLRISIKSELSMNKVTKEIQNIMFMGKTSKPFNKLFTFKIN